LTVREQLQEIHTNIERRWKYVSDDIQWGTVERWLTEKEAKQNAESGDTIQGDCDDFALTARYMCRQKDIPTRLVICKTEEDEYHVVLESEGWIIDNRMHRVVARDSLRYKWIAISGYEKGEQWKWINKNT